jgi:hypothetical protein
MSIKAIKSIDGQLASSETAPENNPSDQVMTYAIAAELRVSKKDNFLPWYPSWKTSFFKWEYAGKYIAENGISRSRHADAPR